MIRVVLGAIVFLILSKMAIADFTNQMEVHQKLGYAQAAVEACESIKLNPKGVLEVIQTLDATDQAAVAAQSVMTDHQAKESAKMFSMLGNNSCEAALDYEKKLGIDIFIDR